MRTRLAILNGAAEVIVIDGPDASVNEMLANAGATKGAMYFHFDTKAGVVQGVLDEASTRVDFLDDLVASHRGEPSRDAVSELLVAYADRCRIDPILRADAMLWSNPLYDSVGGFGTRARLRGAVGEILASQQARRPDDLADAVMAILTALLAPLGAGRGAAAPETAVALRRMISAVYPGTPRNA